MDTRMGRARRLARAHDGFVICFGYKGYVIKEYYRVFVLRIPAHHWRPRKQRHHF